MLATHLLTRCIPTLACLACLACLHPAAEARPVKTWSYETLLADSDLVVIATATSSPDEAADRRNAKPDSWVGVNTTFKPQAVLKGKLPADAFTMLHHRYFDKKLLTTVIDGPGFVEFDITGATTYLLFLKKLDDGRYEAVSGQMDPHISVKVLQDYANPPAPQAEGKENPQPKSAKP